MNLVARLWRFLFPPDCDLCGQRRSVGRLGGTWWHDEGCPNSHFETPDGADNE